MLQFRLPAPFESGGLPHIFSLCILRQDFDAHLLDVDHDVVDVDGGRVHVLVLQRSPMLMCSTASS